MGDYDWVAEGVVGFVKSPMWTVPVHEFIDNNCIVFDNDEELKLEYTDVHKKFQTLIEDLLTSYLEELGVPIDQFVSVLQDLDEKSGGQNKDIKRLTEYISYLDDFVSFRALMQKRNVELELEVMRAIQREMQQGEQGDVEGDGTTAPPNSVAAPRQEGGSGLEELTEEEQLQRDIEAAIKASMEDAEGIMKKAEVDDAELQHALLLSMKEEEEKAEREKAKVDEQKAADEAAKQAEIARIEQEKEAKKEAMKAENLQQRANVVAKAVQDAHAVAPDTAESVVAGNTTTAAAKQVNKAPAGAAPAPVPAPVVPAPNQPDVVHVSSGVPPPSSASGLAPLGSGALAPLSRHGTFGAKAALPSIHSFDQVKSAVSQQPGIVPPPQQKTGTSRDAAVEKVKQGPTKEDIEERARKMREQRDKILAAKRSERVHELDDFKRENGIEGEPTNKSPEPREPAVHGTKEDGSMDDAHKKMTVEIARRFRMDIVGSTH